MAEATLATLIVSGPMECWRGWRGRHKAEWTIELHTDGVLYCFHDPHDSMAKCLRERLLVRDARIVDCGTHEGRLCFGMELSDAQCIEEPNRAGVFASRTQHEPTTSQCPRRLVALFFTSDKVLKWRFICYLRRAAGQGSAKLLETTPAVCTPDRNGVYRRLNRPPRIIDEDCDEPLEGHEIEQLADVLRVYEIGRREAQYHRQEHKEELPLHNEEEKSEDTSVRENSEPNATTTHELKPPARLMSSPLFLDCIAQRLSNHSCADCGAAWPTWALLQPFGGFVCIHCVGVHRQLWPSRCRESVLDRWPTEDAAYMATRGNDILNGELERSDYKTALGETVYKPVGSYSSHSVRERFIQYKYEGTFANGKTAESPPLDPDALGSIVEAAGTTSCMRNSCDNEDSGLILGAPVHSPRDNDVHVEEDPLHYVGVAYITVKELEGARCRGAVLSLTNGFQEVRSQPGVAVAAGDEALESRRLGGRGGSGGSTTWDESFQLGVHDIATPLYVALYSSKDELLGVAKWTLPADVATSPEAQLISVPILWWTGTTGGLGAYGLLNALGMNNPSGSANGGMAETQPLLYITVSFDLFG